MSVSCDRCGFSNPPGGTRCQKCGAGLPTRETQALPVVQAPQGQPNPQGVAPQGGNVVVNVNSPQTAPDPPVSIVTHKSRIIAAILAFFCGMFGLHNYYLGYKGICSLQFIVGFICVSLTGSPDEDGAFPYFLIPFLWAMADLYLILTGKKKDVNGLELKWT